MSTNLTLNNAKLFTKYYIVSSRLQSDIETRLAEMGMVVGTVVEVLKKAPLGDPIEIRIKGYKLCIRKTEAEHYNIAPVVDEVTDE